MHFRAWAPVLITLSVLKKLMIAIFHLGRNGSVISHGDESQPPQNGGDGDNVDLDEWPGSAQADTASLFHCRLPLSTKRGYSRGPKCLHKV
jgi:hypothetical protein